MQAMPMHLDPCALRSPTGKPVAFSPMVTPMSRASTSAPDTPLLSLLPEPYFQAFGKTYSHRFSFTKPAGDGGLTRFDRTVSGCSTAFPDEEEMRRGDSLDQISMEALNSSRSTTPDCEFVVSAGLPRLESELGKWAQAVVKAENWVDDETANNTRVRREYLVDNSELRAETIGLAFRRSKNPWDRDHSIVGPMWGTYVAGNDMGDGWIQIGEHFLPKLLDGTRVLRQKAEAMRDGPALTQCGQAVDIESGCRIFFAHHKFSTEGHTTKAVLKAAARMMSAVHLAHAACDAEKLLELDSVPSIDANGIVRGDIAISWQTSDQAARIKKLHKKKMMRKLAADTGLGRHVLGVLNDGKVFIFLVADSENQYRYMQTRKARISRMQAKKNNQGSNSMGVVLTLDVNGVIRI